MIISKSIFLQFSVNLLPFPTKFSVNFSINS